MCLCLSVYVRACMRVCACVPCFLFVCLFGGGGGWEGNWGGQRQKSEKHLCMTDSEQRLRDSSGVVVMMMCHLRCAPVACLCVSLAPSVP